MPYVFGALGELLKKDRPLYLGWCTQAHTVFPAELARVGFPAVSCDMQHGTYDESSAAAAVREIVAAGAAPVVRVPVDGGPMASLMLDSGAAAIVAPMVNTVDDARRFVEFTRFPPLGKRSWGPTSAFSLYGIADAQDYLRRANEALLLVMIETREAIANLEAILDVDGVDGVFVGPSDLSIALTDGARVDPSHPETHKAATEIRVAAASRGKIATILAVNIEDARMGRDAGFDIIALGSDLTFLRQGAAAWLAALRS